MTRSWPCGLGTSGLGLGLDLERKVLALSERPTGFLQCFDTVGLVI